jgi:hypothetical protein
MVELRRGSLISRAKFETAAAKAAVQMYRGNSDNDVSVIQVLFNSNRNPLPIRELEVCILRFDS